MKKVIAALLFAPIPVLAQINTPPACWPADAGGTGSPIVVRAGIAGLAYAWHCPSANQIQSVAGPWAAFIPSFEAEARRLASATNADRDAAWKKYVTRTAALSDGVAKLKAAAVEDVKTRYVK